MKVAFLFFVLGVRGLWVGETAVLGTEAAGSWALQAAAECCRP